MENISQEKERLRILFLASDPTNASKLHLGKELQEVRNRLADNRYFEIKDHWAVKPDDVIQTIVEYKPHIVHFSGHGEETGELCFEDEQGKVKPIAPDALANLFELVKENVKCVVVNTCYSERQAKAISQYVPVVIGTMKEISDSAAIKFSTGFYTALDPDLSPQSLDKAFKQGQIAIQFEGNLNEKFTPVLIFGSLEVRFSSQVDTAFASIIQPKGVTVKTLIRGLSLIGRQMGLDEDTVNRIIDKKIQKLENHNVSIIEYERSLKEILRDEFPLSKVSLEALSQLQKGLNLSDRDVESINQKIMADPKLDNDYSWFDRGRGQYELMNYERAIEYYTKAIEKNPEYSAAYFERGDCYHKIQRYDYAIEDFNKAVEYNKNWEVASSLSIAYFSRGLSYFSIQPPQKKNVALALEDWTKSIELNPSDTNAFYNRGLANQYLRNFDKAISDFKKSLEIDNINPNKVKASRITNIVRCYQELGNQEEVNRWGKIALKYLEEKDSAPVLNHGGNDGGQY